GALVGAGGAVVLTALLGRRALRRLALFGLGLLSGLALGLLGGGDLLFRRTDLDGDGTGGRGQSRLDLRVGLAVTLVGGLDRGEADRGEVGDRNRGSGIGLRSGSGLGSGIRVRLGRRGGGTTEEHAGGHRGAGGDTGGGRGRRARRGARAAWHGDGCCSQSSTRFAPGPQGLALALCSCSRSDPVRGGASGGHAVTRVVAARVRLQVGAGGDVRRAVGYGEEVDGPFTRQSRASRAAVPPRPLGSRPRPRSSRAARSCRRCAPRLLRPRGRPR